MDWRDLAADLIKAGAPVIGTAIGGPFGGMIGTALGGVLANALGVEATPDAVDVAIKTTPADQLTARLQAAEAEAQAKWPALAQMTSAESDLGKAQVEAIGETMRAELQLAVQATGAWKTVIAVLQSVWRPFAMVVWVLTWPFQLVAILHHAYMKDAAALQQLSGLVYALAVWNAGPAGLAGVYAWGRTREKLKALVGDAVSGAVAPAVKAVLRRK